MFITLTETPNTPVRVNVDRIAGYFARPDNPGSIVVWDWMNDTPRKSMHVNQSPEQIDALITPPDRVDPVWPPKS